MVHVPLFPSSSVTMFGGCKWSEIFLASVGSEHLTRSASGSACMPIRLWSLVVSESSSSHGAQRPELSPVRTWREAARRGKRTAAWAEVPAGSEATASLEKRLSAALEVNAASPVSTVNSATRPRAAP